MRLVKEALTKQLAALLVAWVKEDEENREHDTDECQAWNALVEYLMELEGKNNAISN